ncbi:glycine cleavage system aminomethyltransferase GcvT [Halovivax gelatinilyticus]|uniref:glycine cleavage system aminomethyltransferase GcvT n=1 Tax=Halovivax gelatinilyticus TaxID=2961597 RepID=UPI0020CA8861|nr:glycine cleavage system aminomethyltransferase GcvT [Halovivax gelatinilyticus]
MSLQSPPLRGVHDDRGATFTEFGGWEMPVEFDGIRTEHEAVRDDAGVFDVSHMGQIEVRGPDALPLMNRLTTNDASRLDPGHSQYAAITDEDGVMIDDTVVYRLPDRDGERVYLFVPNAGSDEAMTERWESSRESLDLDAAVENVTHEYGMIAVQGPNTPDIVTDAVDESDTVAALDRFTATDATVRGVECWIARTGYTGEDGFELIFPADDATAVWDEFVPACQPCGLGARDTLRLEAGYLLSGQDFDPDDNPRTPYEAGIGFAVALETDFVGRDALQTQNEDGVDENLVGFGLDERGIARHGYDVESIDGDVIGTVTSGTMSPTLDRAIGLAYVPVEYADPGTELSISVRGRTKRAKVEPIPFIDTV